MATVTATSAAAATTTQELLQLVRSCAVARSPSAFATKPVPLGQQQDTTIAEGMTAARTSGCSLSHLACVLHGDAAKSIGDVFCEYAEYFKVYQQYTNNLDAAWLRVDAFKKIDVFQRAIQQVVPAGIKCKVQGIKGR